MGRAVEVEGDEVVVRLDGLAVLAALKRKLRIPLRAIRAVSAGRYEGDGLRFGGTSVPWTGIRGGRFRRAGLRTFVSFEDRDHVLALTLDRGVPGAQYDVVAVGMGDPNALAAEIEALRQR